MIITPHPERAKFSTRLGALGRSKDVTFDGELFRFVNPAYSTSADIVNGMGAQYAAGRWNLAGPIRLSYTATAPMTALGEALSNVRYYHLPEAKAMPRVVVALQLKARRVLDLRDGKVRNMLRLSEKTIRMLDWRAENQSGKEAVTQAWGHAFSAAGFEAVIVPSAADGGGANLLVFPQNLQPGSLFEVKDEVKWPGK